MPDGIFLITSRVDNATLSVNYELRESSILSDIGARNCTHGKHGNNSEFER